jgi:hypothetical protein
MQLLVFVPKPDGSLPDPIRQTHANPRNFQKVTDLTDFDVFGPKSCNTEPVQ